jgi:hypothetical protein
MGLYNTEYNAIYDFKRAVRKMVNDYLAQDETFARLQNYIELANTNIEKVGEQIKANNLYYEDCTFVSFSFDKSSLLTPSYEMTLHYKQGHEDKFAHFGVDSFLLILIECGLLSD